MEDDTSNMTVSSAQRPFIVRFYGNEQASDSEGRTLSDMLSFNDRELEYHHDYIQYLFPLPERSPFNPHAPVVTELTRDAFLQNADLRDHLFKAFTRMARFYSFDVSGDATAPALSPKLDFAKSAKRSWLMRMNHNHLRITRIIRYIALTKLEFTHILTTNFRCLRILGLEEVAQVFYQALVEHGDPVSPRSRMYWQRAAERPLYLPPDEDDESATGIEWLLEA